MQTQILKLERDAKKLERFNNKRKKPKSFKVKMKKQKLKEKLLIAGWRHKDY